jgi:hypothetical protein
MIVDWGMGTEERGLSRFFRGKAEEGRPCFCLTLNAGIMFK